MTVSDSVRVVTLSAAERQHGRYSPETLTKALEGLHQDGLVLLRGVVDVDHVDRIGARMTAEAEKWMNDPEQEYNHNVKSNFLQRPPINDAELLFDDVYFNAFVLQVANSYLGPRPTWNWLTANTAMANTSGMRQAVHKDCSFRHPLFPYYFIANIPLCDFSVANGSTEFWLGSHATTTWRDNVIATDPSMLGNYGRLDEPLPAVNETALAARRAIRPPIQPTAQRGDVLIRDLRTWHAGMPNESDGHRIMLGLGYQAAAHPNYSMRVHLPAKQEDFFLGSAPEGLVNVRANLYSDEELAKTKQDAWFDLRPTYLE